MMLRAKGKILKVLGNIAELYFKNIVNNATEYWLVDPCQTFLDK